MTSRPAGTEGLIRRDRALVLTGLFAVSAIAWVYLVRLGAAMDAMGMGHQMAMPHVHSWGAGDLVLLFAMWAVMMLAMMTPSATPLLLVFARATRERDGRRVVASTTMLLFGYLLAWWGFSALATLAQWGLHEAALLSADMTSRSRVLGSLLLLAAGVFQLTPLKRACLVRCRSPLSFLMSEWRDGQWGALLMGAKHGLYCVGCCWALMGLLFVAGVMNLLWVAAVAAFVMTEKIAPGGERLGRVAGAGLIVAGIALGVG